MLRARVVGSKMFALYEQVYEAVDVLVHDAVLLRTPVVHHRTCLPLTTSMWTFLFQHVAGRDFTLVCEQHATDAPAASTLRITKGVCIHHT